MEPTIRESEVVQITTMLGSSMVSVDQIGRARKTRSAWLFFIISAALFLVCAISFFGAVRIAKINDAAFTSWLDQGKVAGDFRPVRVGRGYDVLAFGGFIVGLAALTMGVAARQRRRRKQTMTVGSSADAAVDLQRGEFVFVDAGGAQPTVNLVAGMQYEWRVDGAEVAIGPLLQSGANGCGTLLIPESGTLRVAVDKLRFFIARTPAPQSGLLSATFAADGRATAFLGASALVHALVLALLWSVPPDASRFVMDPSVDAVRMVSLHTTSFEDDKKDPSQTDGDSGEATGAAISGDPGKAGTTESTSTAGRRAVKKRADVEQLSREQAIMAARNSGVNRFLRENGDLFQHVLANTDFSSGLEDRDVLGGHFGDVGEVSGTFGHHIAGYMTGGDNGTYHSSTRFGRCLDLANCKIGQHYGDGLEWGTGGPAGGRDPRRKSKAPPVISFGPVEGGGPDKEIIRRYVKRKTARFRFCYERGLLANPELSGEVDTNFVIATNGAVLSAYASGLDPSVAGCVAEVLKTIQFPAFGQPAKVRYPFTFRSN